MKITRMQLRQLIKEAAEEKAAPVKLSVDDKLSMIAKIINASNKIIAEKEGYWYHTDQAKLGNLVLQMLELAKWGEKE